MDPIKWFQQNVMNRGAAVAPKGGAIVPVKAGQVVAPGGIQQITTNMNVPGGPRGAGLLRGGAQTVGFMGAEALAKSAGRPGQSRMSMFGADFKGDAPVYSTPLNQDPITSASSGKTRLGGVEYDLSIPEHKEKYDAVIKADRERPGRTQMADLRGGDGLGTDGNRLGRNTPAPDGNSGAGTKAVPSGAGFTEANKLLRDVGVGGVGYGEFQSNSLFTGDTSGIKATDPSQQVESMVDMPNFAPQDNITADFQAQIPKGSEFSVSEAVVPEAAGSFGSNRPGITGELGTKERYRSEMLRNGNTALGGLRGAEASKGLLYASGKYWQANPNAGQEGQKDFLEISNKQAKAIKSSDMNAQDFLASKIDKVSGIGPVKDGDEYSKMLNN